MYRCPKRRCVIDLTISSDEDDYDFLDDISIDLKTTKDTSPVVDTVNENPFGSCVHATLSECCLHPVMTSRSFTSKCADICSCLYTEEYNYSPRLSYESGTIARNLESSPNKTIPSSRICVHARVEECCFHPNMSSTSYTDMCAESCSCPYTGTEAYYCSPENFDDQKEPSYEPSTSTENLASSLNNAIPSSLVRTTSPVWTILIRDKGMTMFLDKVDLCRLACCCNDFHIISKPEVSELNVLSLLVGLGYLSSPDNKLLIEKYLLGELQECMNSRCSAFFPSSTSFHGHCSTECFLSYIPGCYKCFIHFLDIGDYTEDEFGYRCYPLCSEELVSGEESEYNQ